MKVYLFRKRFWDPIVEGAKRQTIRRVRKHPPKPGEDLSLRGWSDKPYRSPQTLLREAACVGLEPLTLEFVPAFRVELAGRVLTPDETVRFVQADGFADIDDFLGFWSREHGLLPFEGQLTRW